MRLFLMFVVAFTVTACQGFQMPAFHVEDKESGDLIGCAPIPDTELQKCDYEDEKRKWSVTIPVKAAQEAQEK